MNNHRRKGHRCAGLVHYESGIIAFLTLLPIVMKSWQLLTLSDRLCHGSITHVCVDGVCVFGGGVGGVQLAFVGKECLSSPSINHFQVRLTNGTNFIKGLCHCILIVLE